MKKLLKDRDGFTLIELMVVMAIIAVLAVLIIGAIQLARRTATETTNRSNAKTIQIAMESNYAKNKSYDVFTAKTFTSAATTLGVTLNSTCTGTGDGGGLVTSTATTYTITPYNYNCGAALGASDVLTVN